MRYLKGYKNFENAEGSTSAGMGGVSSAQAGGLPGTTGTVGSGDIPFYFKKGSRRRKKGNPSQVSDLRDLALVKINKVNESFTNSSEYSKVLSEFEWHKLGIDNTFILDNLEDVKSMSRAKISLHRYISNSKGHMLNTEFENDETYTIKYVVTIQYKLSSKNEDINYKTYSNMIEDLGIIKTSIDEMMDRCSEKLKITHNNTTITPTTSSDCVISNIIHFDTEELDKSVIKKAFDEWMSDRGPEFDKMLKELRNIYKQRSIDFDMYMDTNDVDDYILIGVFPPDEELYGVAEFDKKTKKWSIDRAEINASILAFDNQDE